MPKDPSEKISVTLSIVAHGTMKVKMTRKEFEEKFPSNFTSIDADEVNLDWYEMVQHLDFEIDDAWTDDLDEDDEEEEIPEE